LVKIINGHTNWEQGGSELSWADSSLFVHPHYHGLTPHCLYIHIIMG